MLPLELSWQCKVLCVFLNFNDDDYIINTLMYLTAAIKLYHYKLLFGGGGEDECFAILRLNNNYPVQWAAIATTKKHNSGEGKCFVFV